MPDGLAAPAAVPPAHTAADTPRLSRPAAIGEGESDWVRHTTTAISRGDRGALAVFYEAWFDPCYAMVRSVTKRDESFCLDVVQETIMRVIRSMKPLGTYAELNAWMMRAVHTTAIDLLRRESRRLRREAARGQTGAAAMVNAADERIGLLLVKLAELPATDRSMVGLRFAHGRSLDAVAAATGMTGDAAHGRIRRAIDRLRRLTKGARDES